MSTFAKSSFDAAVYAASRPTYPKALFQLIFNYHEKGAVALPGNSSASTPNQGPQSSTLRPRWNTAVDLGCGTGQATTELSPFKTVIGVEPSKGMVQKAREQIEKALGSGMYIHSILSFIVSDLMWQRKHRNSPSFNLQPRSLISWRMRVLIWSSLVSIRVYHRAFKLKLDSYSTSCPLV